jgi:hypothetical protein
MQIEDAKPAVVHVDVPNLLSMAASKAHAKLLEANAANLYMGKYNIWSPDTVKYVERTDFLKALAGNIEHVDSLEQVVSTMKVGGSEPTAAAIYELRNMAQTYVSFRNKGARLPNFGRWVNGMFAGNKEFQKILADEGQKAAARKIILSVDVLDILRSADTPHFSSCFRKGDAAYTANGYSKVPVKIAEECPGIGIVYVDDENGYMLGRLWMHHAKIKKTGEDILVLCETTYGCLSGSHVASILANKGVKVAVSSYGRQNRESTEVEYIGCFTRSLHHDLDTWSAGPKYVNVIQQ